MSQSNQVLVQTTATRLDASPPFVGRTGVVIQNNGPYAIYVRIGVSTGLAVGYGMKLNPADVWSFPLKAGVPIYALAATAAQVAGAATDVTEI